MKKLVLAAAIAGITASTAQAATVYEGKGLRYDLKGDWQVQLRDNASKTKDMELEFDDLEIKNRITYDLGGNMKAFGQLDYGFKDAAENNGKNDGGKLEEAYLGLDFGSVSIQAGKMDKAADDFGVEGAIENALGDDVFDAFGSANGDDVIRLDAKFGMVSVALSHELDAEGEDSEGDESTELFLEAGFDALTLGVGYQTWKENIGDPSTDIWGVSASFDAGIAEIGVDYGVSDQGGTSDVAMLNAVVSFKASKQIKVAVGYAEHDYDDSAANSQEAIYANVTYKFPEQKNVSVFAELTERDDDAGTGYDTDILAGMRIKF